MTTAEASVFVKKNKKSRKANGSVKKPEQIPDLKAKIAENRSALDEFDEEAEEEVDLNFDKEFEIFKPTSGGYLEDTWAGLSKKKTKKDKPAEKVDIPGKSVEDRLRTKEAKITKKQKREDDAAAAPKAEALEEEMETAVKDEDSTETAFHVSSFSNSFSVLYDAVRLIFCYRLITFLAKFFASLKYNLMFLSFF